MIGFPPCKRMMKHRIAIHAHDEIIRDDHAVVRVVPRTRIRRCPDEIVSRSDLLHFRSGHLPVLVIEHLEEPDTSNRARNMSSHRGRCRRRCRRRGWKWSGCCRCRAAGRRVRRGRRGLRNNRISVVASTAASTGGKHSANSNCGEPFEQLHPPILRIESEALAGTAIPFLLGRLPYFFCRVWIAADSVTPALGISPRNGSCDGFA